MKKKIFSRARCAEERLLSYGLRPLKPVKGEAQWQLTHGKSQGFKAEHNRYQVSIRANHVGGSRGVLTPQERAP